MFVIVIIVFQGSQYSQKGNSVVVPPSSHLLSPDNLSERPEAGGGDEGGGRQDQRSDRGKVTSLPSPTLSCSLTSSLGLRCSQEREGGGAGAEQKQTGE